MAVQWDPVNSTLQKELQNKLILELAQVGIWHDPRAARDMVPDEVWEEMAPDPEIAALRRKRGQLERGTCRISGQEYEEEVQLLTTRTNLLEAKQREDVQEQYREYYCENRPT